MITAALAAFLLLLGYRYDHRSISYDGTPEVAAAVRAWHLPDGGVSDKPDIKVEWDMRPGRNGAVSLPDVDCELGAPDCTLNRVTHGCTIVVDRSWYESLDPALQSATFTHEVGHCLGLAHDDGAPSIMHSVAPASSVPTVFDLSKVVRLYPASRVVVAGLAR